MEQNDKFAFVKTALAERAEAYRLRELTAVEPVDAVSVRRRGQTLLNFSANDYLGLSKHTREKSFISCEIVCNFKPSRVFSINFFSHKF